jgi:hypothetical protein
VSNELFFAFLYFLWSYPSPCGSVDFKMLCSFFSRSLNPTSIGGYLNVIRISHLSAGFKNPLLDNWELAMIKRGITREMGRPPVQKLPVTIDILRSMFVLLDCMKVRDLSFWAACLVCFYGLLRKNTLLPICGKSKSKAHLVRSDVVEFSRHSFLLRIRQTKTIQFGQRVLELPYVSCVDETLCPVAFLLRHLVRSPLPGNIALFSYVVKGRVVHWTHTDFVTYLRLLLTRLGFDPSAYSGHSFRRGGCSACFQAGLNITDIKLRGDWRSHSFEKYLYVPASAVYKGARALADFAGQ